MDGSHKHDRRLTSPYGACAHDQGDSRVVRVYCRDSSQFQYLWWFFSSRMRSCQYYRHLGIYNLAKTFDYRSFVQIVFCGTPTTSPRSVRPRIPLFFVLGRSSQRRGIHKPPRHFDGAYGFASDAIRAIHPSALAWNICCPCVYPVGLNSNSLICVIFRTGRFVEAQHAYAELYTGWLNVNAQIELKRACCKSLQPLKNKFYRYVTFIQAPD